MINRLKRAIRNWLESSEVSVPEVWKEDRLNARGGMQFTVHRANGGHVVEYRKYVLDHHGNEDWENSLHIINDDADLGTEIGKIIMIESLRA